MKKLIWTAGAGREWQQVYEQLEALTDFKPLMDSD
jgi:hypothetical protein